MSLVDTREKTFQVKIVYYGPGLSGKTTNLEMLSKLLHPERRGDLMVLDTVGDRTLFFDWMPVELGKIRGFDVKIQLYTVPGQVRYNNTRRRVLEGVDGLVFVVDSQAEALDQNAFSLENLRENLADLGMELDKLPMVVQYNKRDLPSALPVEELAAHLGLEDRQYVESVASEGKGVLETLRLITRLTLQAVKEDLDPTKPVSRRPSVPMDGEGLLEHIMRGGEAARDEGREAEAPDEHVLEAEPADDWEEGAGEQEAPAETATGAVAGPGDTEEGAGGGELRGRLEALAARLDALEESLGALREQVEQSREGELGERVMDVVARLDVVQRVVSSLGGKVAALDRRVGRLERADTGPRRADDMARLAGLLTEMGKVLADYAQNLGRPDDREGEPSE